jgi:ABC-type multidrug transport system ATPase subunit
MNSGSGKTTLLNALNFRISSNLRVEGEIMINGASVDSNKMSLLSCYIQQDDLFFWYSDCTGTFRISCNISITDVKIYF